MAREPAGASPVTQQRRLLDLGSSITIGITLVLFGVALFTTGFSHDLLLEAGVFLVSVKLMIMSYKNSATDDEIRAELKEIKKALERPRIDAG